MPTAQTPDKTSAWPLIILLCSAQVLVQIGYPESLPSLRGALETGSVEPAAELMVSISVVPTLHRKSEAAEWPVSSPCAMSRVRMRP